MYDEFKMRLLNAAFNLAGTVITQQISGKGDKQQELIDDYHLRAMKIAEKAEKERIKTPRKPIPLPPLEEPVSQPIPEYRIEKDISPEKIEQGVSCLPCSRDHISTASAVLNEALRFARKEGVGHVEVQRRIGMALDELNAMERIDLAAESIERLTGREKEVALEAANDSRELRHGITAIKTPDDLQKVSAQASNIRTKFMTNIFELSTKDGTVEKLCKGLTGEEKQKCITVINNVLSEKKEVEKI
jgi:hypothetical protein